MRSARRPELFRRHVSLAGMIVLAIVVNAPIAQAAKVHVEQTDSGNRILTYAAEPGETNRVTLDFEEGRAVIHDSGAQIVAGTGCQSRDSHTVECTNFFEATGAFRDGADVVEVVRVTDDAAAPSLDGGSGPDTLSACERCPVGLHGSGGISGVRRRCSRKRPSGTARRRQKTDYARAV